MSSDFISEHILLALMIAPKLQQRKAILSDYFAEEASDAIRAQHMDAYQRIKKVVCDRLEAESEAGRAAAKLRRTMKRSE